MEYVIAIFFGIVGSLLAAEFYSCAPVLARRIIDRAAQRLPEGERERYAEEWLADLEAFPGNLWKLKYAVGCFYGVAGMTTAIPKIAVTHFRKANAHYFVNKTNVFSVVGKSISRNINSYFKLMDSLVEDSLSLLPYFLRIPRSSRKTIVILTSC
jgi:hypothetical protein